MSAEIIKTRREFVKTSNITVLAGAKETIFDEAFKGSVRTLSLFLNFNDTSGGDNGAEDSHIIITIDDETVIDLSLQDLYGHFSGNNLVGAGVSDLIRFTDFDLTAYEFAVIFDLQTLVKTGVKVEVNNVDITNVVQVRAGLVYDH